MPTVRVIVLNYKRPENVLQIVKAFEGFFPITIINNNPNESIRLPGIDPKSDKNYKTIEIINNNDNLYCMDRWLRCYQFCEEYKLILDDDILPHINLVTEMLSRKEPIVGIYGKSNVCNSSSYEELSDHWCVNANVDFLVGSAILVKQDILNLIRDDLFKVGHPKRGDDIIVSYLIKKQLKMPFLKTIEGKVLSLPEGSVGLNKDPEHFSMRWNVVEKFKNLTW